MSTSLLWKTEHDGYCGQCIRNYGNDLIDAEIKKMTWNRQATLKIIDLNCVPAKVLHRQKFHTVDQARKYYEKNKHKLMHQLHIVLPESEADNDN